MIRRGEIWWADLPEPRRSEPGYRRPVLVIQANDFNASSISTVLVIVLTSSLDLAAAPGNTLLKRRETGLPRDSVANVSQVFTLDKAYLRKRVGTTGRRVQEAVDAGLKLILALGR